MLSAGHSTPAKQGHYVHRPLWLSTCHSTRSAPAEFCSLLFPSPLPPARMGWVMVGRGRGLITFCRSFLLGFQEGQGTEERVTPSAHNLVHLVPRELSRSCASASGEVEEGGWAREPQGSVWGKQTEAARLLLPD